MADSNPTDCVECSPSLPVDQDVQAERAILAFLLDEYPAQLTIPEAFRALNGIPGSFEAHDAVERAIRELDGAGLVHCRGGFAVPTRAALYLVRLWED